MEKIIAGLLFIYLVSFPFGQLNRLSFINRYLSFLPQVNFYLTDLIMFLFVIFWLAWRLVKVKGSYPLPPLAKPILFFGLIAFVSWLVNASLFQTVESITAGLYLARWLIYAGLYFALFDLKRRFDWLKWQNISAFLLVLGTSVAILGLLQYFFWPNLSDFEYWGWDPHYYRLAGTFLDPGFSGIILVLSLILLINRNWNVVSYCLFVILYSALALTYSRSSFLAYLAGMGVIAFIKKTPRFFLAMILLLFLTLISLPRYPGGEGVKLERQASTQARWGNWQRSLLLAQDKPILGVGFNFLRYVQRDKGFLGEGWSVSQAAAGLDSSLLFVLVTTGGVGLLSYLWLWGKALRLGWSARKEIKPVILASAVALLIHSLFLNSLFYPWVMAWWWIILGSG